MRCLFFQSYIRHNVHAEHFQCKRGPNLEAKTEVEHRDNAQARVSDHYEFASFCNFKKTSLSVQYGLISLKKVLNSKISQVIGRSFKVC